MEKDQPFPNSLVLGKWWLVTIVVAATHQSAPSIFAPYTGCTLGDSLGCWKTRYNILRLI
jgi:hypothetical protein